MALKVSARGSIPPFIAMDVLREANKRAAEGEDILHLEVGQPGTPAPRPVLEAVRQALETNLIGYTDALGLPDLRQAIAGHYHSMPGTVSRWRHRAIRHTAISCRPWGSSRCFWNAVPRNVFSRPWSYCKRLGPSTA
jgi:hypothetical protein